ncbi:Golgi transport complex subunit 5-domain-containing protein [Hygrophoropsis aurantiaca]|uniref:Golgi transport complex subunit 5-domain-containing protein n=1 Tax=Hygrophoropsis aurantiaca TaxID=72124 RepID=A0ACB7ZZ99_9AGAM|nr:Golgi transport complex subunit 5-domain-containing protein [Hygrophoropsis aurantiaca]
MTDRDYTVFAHPSFDANEYANAVLAGEAYPATTTNTPTSRGDIPLAISKLDVSLDDVTKQIKTLVHAHHEDLLAQAAGINTLAGSLASVRQGLDDVDASLEKLQAKIRIPYHALRAHVSRLERTRQASDVLRRAARIVVLVRRLEAQLADLGADASNTAVTDESSQRTIAQAALAIAESGPSPCPPSLALLDEPSSTTSLPLSQITAIAAHIPFIHASRTRVTQHIDTAVLRALDTLDQPLLASSLQAAHNLRVLPALALRTTTDLVAALDARVRAAFDLAAIMRDVGAKDPAAAPPTPTPASGLSLLYKSRVRTEPTSITAPACAAALWARIEGTVEDLVGVGAKIYTLEKVLRMKKDARTGALFLDEAMKPHVLESKPSTTFWTALARALEKYARDGGKASPFLQQTLATGYPRLLRLLVHGLFAKVGVYMDATVQRGKATAQHPETHLILSALSTFAALYLARASTRMADATAAALRGLGVSAAGVRTLTAELLRVLTNELDAARSDPGLARAVAGRVRAAVEGVAGRLGGAITTDRTATTLLGPLATPQQLQNGAIATCLYGLWMGLSTGKDAREDAVGGIMAPAVQGLRTGCDRVLEPLVGAVRRELGAIIARLHRVDFQKARDPAGGGAGMGMGMGGGMGAGASLYVKDLADKLSFVKLEVMAGFAPEVVRDWTPTIVKYTIRTFLLHASIAKPLGESGKLQLTADMTELEFALSAFMLEGGQHTGTGGAGRLESVGEEYKALRAMRPLLFLDTPSLASPAHTAALPPLLVLHHILVRSPLPLPHALHGWQEAEYVRWVGEHAPEEAWALVESGLRRWEGMRGVDDVEGGGKGRDVGKADGDGQEYVELARRVLAHAKSSSASN